jgi:carboxymethylenebutenolidase
VGTNVAATVVYYGNVAKSADQLAPLNGPVLGHFATRDRWINRTMVDGFDAAMRQAGKRLDAHWYDADHAFANPTSARYDAADAALAWQRTLAFLRANL